MFHQSHLTIIEQTLQVVFPALEELVIEELPQITQICDNMEVIISMKGEEEYNEAETKDDILFPKLSTLRLEQLNNLKSFYSSTCEAQPLFNKQVKMSHILVLHVHPSAHTKKETIPKVYVFIYIDTIHGTN